MKEWLKSVLNYRSYPKNKTGYPFWTTLYWIFKGLQFHSNAYYTAGVPSNTFHSSFPLFHRTTTVLYPTSVPFIDILYNTIIPSL